MLQDLFITAFDIRLGYSTGFIENVQYCDSLSMYSSFVSLF